jgi:glycine hydroxymethyltransferase
MHVIAAKAVALKEAMQPEFREYQQRVLDNARAMAEVFVAHGLRIVSGGTRDHLFLVDLSARGITGKAADAALGAAHITVNKNAVPNDPQPPFVTSGIRVGSPAITSRGFGVDQARQLASWMCEILDDPDNTDTIARVRGQVIELCRRFPVYPRQRETAAA